MEIVCCGSKAYNVQHQKFVDSHRWPKFKTLNTTSLRGAPVVHPPTLHRFVLGPFRGAVRVASMPAFIHSFIHSFLHSFIHSVILSFCQSVSQSVSPPFIRSSIHRSAYPRIPSFLPLQIQCGVKSSSFCPLTTPDLSPILISSKGCDDKGYRKDSSPSWDTAIFSQKRSHNETTRLGRSVAAVASMAFHKKPDVVRLGLWDGVRWPSPGDTIAPEMFSPAQRELPVHLFQYTHTHIYIYIYICIFK